LHKGDDDDDNNNNNNNNAHLDLRYEEDVRDDIYFNHNPTYLGKIY